MDFFWNNPAIGTAGIWYEQDRVVCQEYEEDWIILLLRVDTPAEIEAQYSLMQQGVRL